ncbi:MAG: hypothetical protein CVV27_09430 [Candidatus Melainabacteria bacterium HGW-Melainabacteria-1]|nr:MAG: hypothetical protein CVV27_09430 [Candidatus Melainabacteria bacterium HGW-Melainabacteria-1]
MPIHPNDLVSLIDRLPDSAVYVFDRDYRYTLASGEEIHRKGLSGKAITGQTLWEVFSEADACLLEPYYRAAIAGQSVQFEHPLGETWYHHSFFPLTSPEDGQIVGGMKLARNITKHKRADQARQQQLEIIFEQAYELMAILSPAGRLQNANLSLRELLGLQLDACRQQNLWQLPGWKDDPAVAQRLRSAVMMAADGQEVRYEETIKAASGRNLILDLSLKPALSLENEVLALIVEGRDITSLKRAQQLAEKTSQMLTHHNQQLENFAHITSHNLRSPATNIQMLLNLFEQADNPEDRAYALSKLQQSSRRLLETLDVLADNLSIRMDTGIEKSELLFAEVLEHTRDLLTAQILLADADIIADFSLAPLIDYPPSYLESIFLNLLSNALKYRAPGRRPLIRLHSWYERGHVHLRVSDNGLGINLNRHSDKIFGLYKTFHRNPDARGVGLFLTKSQIEALGGQISVKSEPDSGTTFHLVF